MNFKSICLCISAINLFCIFILCVSAGAESERGYDRIVIEYCHGLGEVASKCYTYGYDRDSFSNVIRKIKKEIPSRGSDVYYSVCNKEYRDGVNDFNSSKSIMPKSFISNIYNKLCLEEGLYAGIDDKYKNVRLKKGKCDYLSKVYTQCYLYICEDSESDGWDLKVRQYELKVKFRRDGEKFGNVELEYCIDATVKGDKSRGNCIDKKILRDSVFKECMNSNLY